MNIEQAHISPLALRAGAWILTAIALRILWAHLRPILGLSFGKPSLRRK